jgi:hypothetical protein
MNKYVFVLPLFGLLAACGSTKAPTKQSADESSPKMIVEKPKPAPAALDPYAKYYPADTNTTPTVTAPGWFIKPPSDRLDVLFAVGTAVSHDEQMAYDKARMAAERKLIESAGVRIQTQTKSYKADRGSTIIENYEQVMRKNANGELAGAQRVDSQVSHDGRSYKVYVLMRLPLGEQNIARKDALQNKMLRESDVRSKAAQRELDAADQKEYDRMKDDADRLQRDVAPGKPISSNKREQVLAKDGRALDLLELETEAFKRQNSGMEPSPDAPVLVR